jgi:methylated-DNA-[protein]-cysteine S-methyltransferase
MKFPHDIVKTRWISPLGPMILATTPRGIAGLWFEGQRHMPDHGAWPTQPDHALLREATTQLQAWFAGTRESFELRLDLQGGTAFQQSVWQALLAIPRGRTTSYGTLSRDIGVPAAARAVGAAVGRNPISIVVPCHRVMSAGGALTGYAGGLERKSALLRLEGVV